MALASSTMTSKIGSFQEIIANISIASTELASAQTRWLFFSSIKARFSLRRSPTFYDFYEFCWGKPGELKELEGGESLLTRSFRRKYVLPLASLIDIHLISLVSHYSPERNSLIGVGRGLLFARKKSAGAVY